MKTFYHLSLLLALTILLAASCKAPQPTAGIFNRELQKGKDSSGTVFVVKKNGEKVTGKSLDFSHEYAYKFKADEWVAVDGQKIGYGQYDALQTKKAYQILYNPGQPDKYPYGIYINRIRSGKIDLYEYQPLKGNNDKNKKLPYHVYVFQKNKGKAAVLNFATFTDALSDNPAALDKFKQLFPLGTIPENEVASTLIKLTAVTDLYNGANTDSAQASR